MQLLGFSKDDLRTVFDASSYIFEQAAYRNSNSEALQASLQEIGLNEINVRCT